MKKKTLRIPFISAMMVLLLCSCYEPKEACLDAEASNFDVSADDPCSDCCTYPNLIIRFGHLWDGEALSPGDTLVDDFMNPFIMDQFEYFIGSVYLTDIEENRIQVLDSIELTMNDLSQFETNDFEHITLAQTSYTTGSIIARNDIKEIEFKVGVVPQNLVFDDLNENFTLYTFRDSLTKDGIYIPWQMRFSRDTIDVILEDIDGNAGKLDVISLEKEVSTEIGEEVAIEITVEFKNLLEGINVKDDSSETIVSKMTTNLVNAFN